MNASLNEKLGTVKWGEFKLGDLFEVVSYKKCFDANKVAIIENRGHPYIVRQSTENGRKGNIDEPIKYLNPGNTISFGQDTATMFYQEKPYFTGDKIKILRPKYAKFGKNNAQFFLSTMRKAFCSFAWGSSRFNVETLKKQRITARPGGDPFCLSRSVESETHQRFPFSSKGHSSGSPNTCISLRCRISGSIFSLTMISVTCSVSGMRMMRASFRSMPVLILMAH